MLVTGVVNSSGQPALLPTPPTHTQTQVQHTGRLRECIWSDREACIVVGIGRNLTVPSLVIPRGLISPARTSVTVVPSCVLTRAVPWSVLLCSRMHHHHVVKYS